MTCAKCPLCSSPLSSEDEFTVLTKAVTPTMARILEVLSRNPSGMTVDFLANRLYGHLEDGGPDWAYTSIRTIIYKNNIVLRKLGWEVKSGRSKGYSLLPYANPAQTEARLH